MTKKKQKKYNILVTNVTKMINLQKNEFTIEVLKYYRYNINYYEENNIVAYKNTKEEKQKMQKNEDFEKKMEKNKALNTENEISNVKEKLAASDTKISEEKEDITEEKKVSSANSVGKEKSPKVEKETKVDEATVIEKIKNFIAKIVAMQEEAKKETLDKDESNEKVEKVDKASKEKNKNQKSKEVKSPEYLLEYYDLPYRYNETIVKILAQTPKKLFVYWDISDKDRRRYLNAFGEDFFEKTYPVLLLYNEDKNYVKEIPINDFANSWYIDIDDAKTKYTVQLGRKFKEKPQIINIAKIEEEQIVLKTDYLPFADSNKMEAPNDHVLLEKLPRFVTFRNVKTNQEIVKDMGEFKTVFGKNYNVKEFYEEHYKEEITDGIFDMANPSSNLSSSSFK